MCWTATSTLRFAVHFLTTCTAQYSKGSSYNVKSLAAAHRYISRVQHTDTSSVLDIIITNPERPNPGNIVPDEIKRTLETDVDSLEHRSHTAIRAHGQGPVDTVPDETKPMTEKHVDTQKPEDQPPICSTAASRVRESLFYWLTLPGQLCGGINNVWNVLLLLKRLCTMAVKRGRNV
jgi:hypothetical protein